MALTIRSTLDVRPLRFVADGRFSAALRGLATLTRQMSPLVLCVATLLALSAQPLNIDRPWSKRQLRSPGGGAVASTLSSSTTAGGAITPLGRRSADGAGPAGGSSSAKAVGAEIEHHRYVSRQEPTSRQVNPLLHEADPDAEKVILPERWSALEALKELVHTFDLVGVAAVATAVMLIVGALVRALMPLFGKHADIADVDHAASLDPEIVKVLALRREPRHRTPLRSGMLYRGLRPISDCKILDRSEHGARIRTIAPFPTGGEIRFLDLQEMVFYEGQVAWRTENEAGLQLSRLYAIGQRKTKAAAEIDEDDAEEDGQKTAGAA